MTHWSHRLKALLTFLHLWTINSRLQPSNIQISNAKPIQVAPSIMLRYQIRTYPLLVLLEKDHENIRRIQSLEISDPNFLIY